MNNSNKNKNGFVKMERPVGIPDNVLLFDIPTDGSSSLLTISEVASLLRISETSVRRLQQQRDIPFLKIGGSVRFIKEDIFSYLQKQRVEAIR